MNTLNCKFLKYHILVKLCFIFAFHGITNSYKVSYYASYGVSLSSSNIYYILVHCRFLRIFPLNRYIGLAEPQPIKIEEHVEHTGRPCQ